MSLGSIRRRARRGNGVLEAAEGGLLPRASACQHDGLTDFPVFCDRGEGYSFHFVALVVAVNSVRG